MLAVHRFFIFEFSGGETIQTRAVFRVVRPFPEECLSSLVVEQIEESAESDEVDDPLDWGD